MFGRAAAKSCKNMPDKTSELHKNDHASVEMDNNNHYPSLSLLIYEEHRTTETNTHKHNGGIPPW